MGEDEEAEDGGPEDGAEHGAQGGRGLDQRPPPAVLAPGLYLVATPIGAARDITLRALDVLGTADILAAEDTRTLRRLMEIHGVRRAGRPIVAYNDHSGPRVLPRLLAALRDERSIALCSDAGTPLVADPGYRLVTEAVAEGLPVHAVPGASALLAALTVAGLPTDRFLFAGFLPPRQAARARTLEDLAGVPASLVFFESPRRIAASLAAMAKALGAERPAAVARELTKRHEEVRRGALGALAAQYAGGDAPRGEVVVIVGPPGEPAAGEVDLDAALQDALGAMSLPEAARQVARALGLPRREVYSRALALRGPALPGEKREN